MSKEHTGAGFLIGGLLGGAANTRAQMEELRAHASADLQTIAEYREKVADWMAGGMNMACAQIRLKADYEGMRLVIRQLLDSIKQLDRDSLLLLAKSRDTIAGQASREADEVHADSVFSLQISRRMGMLAVIDACVRELHRLDPRHPLLKTEERFTTYWVAFETECEKRTVTPNQILEWSQERDKVEKYMQVGTEYFGNVAAAAAKRAAKSAKKI